MVRRFLLLITFFCFIAVPAYATFDLILKDGTSMKVTRVTFKGKTVEVYPFGGGKEIIEADRIDYEATGLKRPESAVGVTIYGTSKATKSADSFHSSGTQESRKDELSVAWDKATRKAVAIKDFGAIRAGDTVRIVSNDVATYRILAKSEDGAISSYVIEPTAFFETFKSSDEQKAYEDKFGPYHVNAKDVPVRETSVPFVEPTPPKEEPKEDTFIDVLKKNPLLVGGGVVILLVVVIIFRGKR